MAHIINMHKAIREIRLDDSEDSPTFTLDLTDKGMQSKAVAISGCCAVYLNLVKKMKENGITEEISKQLLSVYRVAINVFLGEGSFDVISDWLVDSGSVAPEEMTAAYAPLIEYLFSEYEAVMTANRSSAVEKYLNNDSQFANTL